MISRVCIIVASLVLLVAGQAHAEVDNRLKYEQKEKVNNHLNDRFNIRLTEFHWFVYNELNVEALIRMGSHFAVGPTIGYMHKADGIHKAGEILDVFNTEDETSRFMAGIKAMATLNHINESGVYFTAFGRYQESQVNRDADEDSVLGSLYFDSQGEFTEMVYGATAGYQWQVGMLRLSIGGGYQIFDSPDTIELKRNDARGNDVEVVRNVGRPGSIIIDGGIGLTF